MRTRLSALVLMLLVACACSSKKQGVGPTSDLGNSTGGSASGSGTGGGSGSAVGTGTGTAATGTAGGPSFGEKCGASDVCAEGLACTKYYGIAGASGPQFKSCEKTCGTDTDCPAPRKCGTIADGPGRVCR